MTHLLDLVTRNQPVSKVVPKRMPTRAPLLALLAGLTLATACAPEIHQRVLTTDNRSQLQKNVTNHTSLTDNEKTRFDAALARPDYQPYGKTIARIIADERSYAAAQKDAAVRAAATERAASARAAALKYALDHDIEITPDAIEIKKGLIGEAYPQDWPRNDVDTFAFEVTNHGGKAVPYFDATARLENRGSDTLSAGDIKDAGGLSAHQSKRISIRVTQDYESPPNPELARNTDVGDTVVRYTVNRINFADGSKANRDALESF